MSTISAANSVATQAIMMTVPLGSPSGPSLTLGPKSGSDSSSEGLGSSITASLNGKLLNIAT